MKDFKKLIKEAYLGNPLNEEDRATRVDKMMSGEYEDEDYKDSKRYDDVRGEIDENDEETDYMRRRRGDYSDDMEDGMTDFERRRRETSDYMNENMGEWPKELTSRYSDEYRFELEKVMSDRAKYRVIDIESGELKGTPVFGKPESLMAFADDLIKPQGGTQSSHFGTNEGTCGYGEDGKVDPENTSKLKPAKSEMSDKEMDDEVRRLLKRNFMNEDGIDEELFTPNEMGAKAVEDEMEESLQETLRKNLKKRLS